jgi:hypothetical protein
MGAMHKSHAKQDCVENGFRILHELFYQTAQYIPANVASEYEKCMDELKAVYRRGQFMVNEVNNEFHKLMDPYSAKQDPPITMNYAAAQEHVPRAKRNN